MSQACKYGDLFCLGDIYETGECVHVSDAQNRIRMVGWMSAQDLQRVIAWPMTQKTVRDAAARRLRKLNRQSKIGSQK